MGYIICIYIHILYSAVQLFQDLWIPGNSKSKPPEPRIYTIKQNSSTFVTYFDQTQEQLETLASMDDLLSGMYVRVL